MAKVQRPAITLDDDDEGRRFHATWSRSGKTLIITAGTKDLQTWGQVQLRPDQVQQLIDFLTLTVAGVASDD